MIAPLQTASKSHLEPTKEVTRGLGLERVTDTRRFWLRVLFGLNIIGAGGCGLLILTWPNLAREWLFAGDFVPGAASSVLGCIWIALGLLSVAGLVRPVTFSPVLLVQFAYKLTWLFAIAVPAFANGEPVSPALALIFAGWVVAVGATVPWRHLFSSNTHDMNLRSDREPEATQAGVVPRPGFLSRF